MPDCWYSLFRGGAKARGRQAWGRERFLSALREVDKLSSLLKEPEHKRFHDLFDIGYPPVQANVFLPTKRLRWCRVGKNYPAMTIDLHHYPVWPAGRKIATPLFYKGVDRDA